MRFRCCLFLFVTAILCAGAAHAADYYARTAGSGTVTNNWSQNTTWTTDPDCNGNPLGAGVTPGASDNVFICAGKALVVNVNSQALSVTFIQAGAASSMTHGAGISLTVGSGGVTINGSNSNNVTRSWAINDGSATVGTALANANVTLNEGNANNRIANITLTSGTLTVNGNVVMNNASNNARTTMALGTGFLNISGSFTLSSTFGTLSGSTSTVTYNTNSAATVASGAAISYDHLVINKSGSPAGTATAAATGTLTVTNNLTVQAGTFNTDANGIVAVTGNLAVSNGALFDIATTGNVTITGTTTATGEVRLSAAGGTKLFTGDVTVSVTTGKWNNTGNVPVTMAGNLINNNTTTGSFVSGTGTYTFTVNGSSFQGAGGFTFDGDVTISQTHSNDTAVEIKGNLGGTSTLTNLANRTLKIGGNATISGLTATAVPNTVEYNGVAAQTGKVANYNNLIISSAGTVGFGGSFNITGDLTNNGNFSHTSGTVSFTGAVAQNIKKTGAATNTTFVNLTLNNSAAVASRQVILDHNVTVTTALTLTAGRITTGTANNIYVASGNTIGSAGGNDFVEGNLRKPYSGATVSRVFEIGNYSIAASAGKYTPVTLAFSSVSASGDITVSTANSDHPQFGTSGLDPAQHVNRYWIVTNSGVGFTTYTLTLNYVSGAPAAGDVDAAVVNPAALIAMRYDGANWNPATLNATPTAAQTVITGLTDVGEFAIGEALGYNATLGRYNVYDAGAGASVHGYIRTKIAGPAFTLTVAHLNTTAGTPLQNITTSALVELLDGSPAQGALTNNCSANWTTIIASQTINFANQSTQTVNFNVSGAWKNVRVRVSSPSGGPVTQQGCSGDAFAIRPQSFGVTVSDGSPSTVGTNNTLDATAYNGTPIHIAGKPFSVRVNSTVPMGASNYYQNTTHAGSPVLKSAACANPTGTHPTFGACTLACATGAFSLGGFSVAGGELNATATYGEAGVFDLLLEDTNFAAVDAIDTTLAARTVPQTATFRAGRFVPNDFVLTHSNPALAQFRTFGATDGVCDASASPRRSFTYVGQNFGYAVEPQVLVTARNGLASPTATMNYQQCLWELSGSGVANSPTTSNAGKTLNSTLSDPAVAPANDGSGTGTVTLSSSDLYSFARGTTPDAPYNGAVNLVITATDSDGITSNTLTISSLPFDSGSEFRFGRLRMLSASGSQLLPLAAPLVAEYWNGTAFLTNTADHCTTLAASSIGLGNYRGTLVSGDTTASVSGPFLNGLKSIALTKPAGGHEGSVDLVVNLGTTSTINTCNTWDVPTPAPGGASLAHLRGKWCGSSYDRDPVARARFGILGGPSEVIHIQETIP